MFNRMFNRSCKFETFLMLNNDDFLLQYSNRNNEIYRDVISHSIAENCTPLTDQQILNLNQEILNLKWDHFTRQQILGLFSYIYFNTNFINDRKIDILIDNIYEEATYPHIRKTKFLLEGRFILNINQKEYNRIKISDEVLYTLLYKMFEYNTE